MKPINFAFTLLLGIAILSSCRESEIPELVPETGCATCNCNNMDSTEIAEPFSASVYDSVFYFRSYTAMSGKYVDYSLNNIGSGSLDAIAVDIIWQAENPNFSGEILRFADADIFFDFTTFPNSAKKVSFDINGDLGDFHFLINGVDYSLPQNALTLKVNPLSSGNFIELFGPINNIELGGWELAIDNMCVEDFVQPIVNLDSLCFTFEDSSYSEDVLIPQTSYGAPFYVSPDGISFRTKWVDYFGAFPVNGSVFWGAPYTFGGDENVNFTQQLLQVNNCDLEIDFSSLPYLQKRISFDISNVFPVTQPNEFQVNGNPFSTLPNGVSYTSIPLGNAANGDPSFRVLLEGPINTIVLKGFEATHDNFCVEPF
ncbi:MAG: hypothetical protein AAF927_04820 [Bacteroidota bacterium]